MKDGVQECRRCAGAGCYWCRKSGEQVMCPACGNSEPELFQKIEGGRQCLACAATFEDSGRPLAVAEEEQDDDVVDHFEPVKKPSDDPLDGHT